MLLVEKRRSKAGGYQWERYREEVFPWLYLALFLCFLWPFLAFLFLLSGETDLKTVLLVVLLLLGSLYPIQRKINSPENLRREDGARGEMLVGRELEKLHKEGFHIFHAYYSEGHGIVDHFVVGQPGVSVVETKAWKGEITFENDRYLIDNKPTTMKNPIKQVKGEEKDIRDLVTSCGIESFYVRPILCFSKDELRHHKPVDGVEITSVGSLNRTIMQLSQRIHDGYQLSQPTVREVSKRLQRLLGELPAAAPGSPPEELTRTQRVLKSGGFFVMLYFLVTFVVSIIFADRMAQSLEGVADIYRYIGSVWRYFL